MPDKTETTLTFRADAFKRLAPLFQKGVLVRARRGSALDDFLEHGLGLSPEYVASRIQTIFLNGSPVDDLGTARVGEGDVLALSAAMPGLVGATMRRGGVLAKMRAGISLGRIESRPEEEDVLVRIKLFNFLIPEIGPDLLRAGVEIESAGLVEFLKSQPEDFFQSIEGVVLNGRETALAGPDDLNRAAAPIKITIRA